VATIAVETPQISSDFGNSPMPSSTGPSPTSQIDNSRGNTAEASLLQHLNLWDIAFAPNTTLGFSEGGDSFSGSTAASNTSQAAQFALLEQFAVAQFKAPAMINAGDLFGEPALVAVSNVSAIPAARNHV
jgi:hypothetical protein